MLPPPACPLAQIIDRVGDKWTVLVVGYLSEHPVVRFNALMRAIPGVSHRMLTLDPARLRKGWFGEAHTIRHRPAPRGLLVDRAWAVVDKAALATGEMGFGQARRNRGCSEAL
jgi:hypothetical protein